MPLLWCSNGLTEMEEPLSCLSVPTDSCWQVKLGRNALGIWPAREVLQHQHLGGIADRAVWQRKSVGTCVCVLQPQHNGLEENLRAKLAQC